MSSIDLHLHEIENGWMPPVCARCGDDGEYVAAKTVVWSPWWMPFAAVVTGFIVFLPFLRLAFFALAGLSETNRRVTIHLPFCHRHQNHWRWRWWTLALVMFLSVCLIGGGITVAIQLKPTNDIALSMIGLGAIGFLLWVALKLIMPFTSIRITDLAGTAVTLAGVSATFCKAVAERRLQKADIDAARFETSEYDERLRLRRERGLSKRHARDAGE